MDQIASLAQAIIAISQQFLPITLGIVLGLCGIHIINRLVGYRLNLLGIYPRTWHGFIGIIFSPFLHADFNHLFFNCIPLFILANFVLLFGLPTFINVNIVCVILGGLLLWLFGRRGIHIGASGIIMGYLGFLLIHAYTQPSILTVAIAIVCVYYFGAMLLSVFPSSERTSWDGHLFGLLAGIASAYINPMLMHFYPRF